MKLICLLCVPLLAVAQDRILPNPIGQPLAQPLGREWTVAVATGWQGLGPASAIKQRMNEMGWATVDNGNCIWGCTGPIRYPRVSRNLSFDVEIGYRKTTRHGYQLGFGMPHTVEVKGVRSNRAVLTLDARIWYGSFRWAWFSRNGRWVNSAGPALLIFQDYEPGYAYKRIYSDRHSQLRPGLHLSSQFRFFNRQGWLLAIKADARVGWSAYSRAYAHRYDFAGATYGLSATNIAALSMNIGLNLGFKIH